MNSVIKELKFDIHKQVLFDDSCFPDIEQPLSKERVQELEKTLGKVLLERFQKEFADKRPRE